MSHPSPAQASAAAGVTDPGLSCRRSGPPRIGRNNRAWLAPAGWTVALLVVAGATLAIAQPWWGGGYGRINSRGGVPEWEVDPKFKHDVVTFARVQYSSYRGGGYRRMRGGGAWDTDFPDAELNLAYRLQQMTSLKVNPDAVVVQLGVDDLSKYPFLYIVEPGRLVFEEDELEPLRRHLLSGGFLMIDDFWGDPEWDNLYREIKRVFPDREPQELPLDHPVFHSVFDLQEKPQVPHIQAALAGRPYGITWETEKIGNVREVHIKGIFDDKGRMMVIICHNTDYGDGWEREGESAWYFHEFAEKRAYPMGINIIVYAMTH